MALLLLRHALTIGDADDDDDDASAFFAVSGLSSLLWAPFVTQDKTQQIVQHLTCIG